MGFKLVALDLDGTLLGKDKKISQETSQIIKEKSKGGVIFTIATGRFYESAVKYARQLGVEVPIIAYNGAMIKSSTSDKVYLQLPLEADMARQALELIGDEGVVSFLLYDDIILTDAREEVTAGYEAALGVGFRHCESLKKYLRETNRGPITVLFRVNEENTVALTRRLREHYGQRVTITNSLPFFIEINHPQATKGNALAQLASHLGIKREEIIAVGDSFNDIEMISYAGLGAVVGNAPNEVKKSADFVAEGFEEAGVREIINRFL